MGGSWQSNQGMGLETMRWWLYNKPADMVMEISLSRWAAACTSDPGNCGAEHSGFPATVGPAHPEQVSVAPTAVSWAALIPGPGSDVCGGGGSWWWVSLAGGTESYLLPCDHTEVLNSALSRGLSMGPSTLDLSPEAWESSPLVQGLGGTCLHFYSFPLGLEASHFTSPTQFSQ